MRYASAVAILIFAVAASAPGQRAVSHAGSPGHGGFSGRSGFVGHSGYAGRSGFSTSRGTSRPIAPSRSFSRPYGPFPGNSFTSRQFRRPVPPARSGFRPSYPGRGFDAARTQFRPGYANHYGGRSNDRDRRREHRRPYNSFFGYGFPAAYAYPYYPYPFVIDPGFYDWGDSGDTSDNQGTYANPPYSDSSAYGESPSYPEYGAAGDSPAENNNLPYPPAGRGIPAQAATASVGPAAEEPITVIFKDGRQPEKMQNYMMSSSALTDLDRQHYQQIPLDQIDIAATEQANRAHGVLFQVPSVSHE